MDLETLKQFQWRQVASPTHYCQSSTPKEGQRGQKELNGWQLVALPPLDHLSESVRQGLPPLLTDL